MPSRNYIKSRTRGAPPPQVQWLNANPTKGMKTNQWQFNASELPNKEVTMRQVLSRLQVRFNQNKATQWQNVVCPVCNSRESKALLYGRVGSSGGFICNSCRTKGDALALFASATRIPKAQVRAMWRPQ